VDPIEKKPLFHVLPGTRSLSVAAAGCCFQCEFCQNWQISQGPQEGRALETTSCSPEELLAMAELNRCASISYTYTEPTVFFEFAYDTARLAKQRGIRNCFVSNGYMSSRAVQTIAPYLDAINVDLKAFRDETYRRVMHARLQPVLDCLVALKEAGIWIEVTTLVVPGMNDSSQELKDIAEFIVHKLGVGVPWHVTRFYGQYKMSETPSTELDTLQEACRIGQEAGLRYVYCGNVPGRADENTYCPDCGEIVIERVGYTIGGIRLSAEGACRHCGRRIEGIWK